VNQQKRQQEGIFSFLRIHGLSLFLGLVFIFGTPFIYNLFQKRYLCGLSTNCYFWGGIGGFLLVNVMIGWAVCYYIWIIFSKNKLSILLKVLFPLVLLFYGIGIINFFNFFHLIKDGKVEVQKGITSTRFLIDIKNINKLDCIQKNDAEGGVNKTYFIYSNKGDSVSFAVGEGMFDILNNAYNIAFVGCRRGN